MIYSNLIDAEMNLFVGLNEYVHLVGKDDQYGGAHCSGIIRRMERRWLLAKEREPLSDLAKSISGKGAFAKIHRTEGVLTPILSEITLEQLYHTQHMEGWQSCHRGNIELTTHLIIHQTFPSISIVRRINPRKCS